jgi:ferrous iron transport protein B
MSVIDPDYFNGLRKAFPNQLLYKLWLVITQDVPKFRSNEIRNSFTKSHSDLKRLQQKRPSSATSLSMMCSKGLNIDTTIAKDYRSKLIAFLLIKYGYVIFLILFIIFQSIFEWSKIPMDFIDASFASLSTLAAENLLCWRNQLDFTRNHS